MHRKPKYSYLVTEYRYCKYTVHSMMSYKPHSYEQSTVRIVHNITYNRILIIIFSVALARLRPTVIFLWSIMTSNKTNPSECESLTNRIISDLFQEQERRRNNGNEQPSPEDTTVSSRLRSLPRNIQPRTVRGREARKAHVASILEAALALVDDDDISQTEDVGRSAS